jgi:2'-5' RNA ligase
MLLIFIMARLFTGIAIPDIAIDQLVALQPSPMPGMKLVKPEQIHLTLHFIGEADVKAYRQVLQMLQSPPFSMSIEALGKFTNRKETILWAGVHESAELKALHREMQDALVLAGYQPEKRPYHPHITLARCDGRVPGDVVKAYLAQHYEQMEIKVDEVVLFSSVLSEKGPRYVREAVFALQ